MVKVVQIGGTDLGGNAGGELRGRWVGLRGESKVETYGVMF